MDDYGAAIAEWRRERDRFFAEHYATPLSDEMIESFSGLRYYTADSQWCFEVMLEPGPDSVNIVSSTGSVTAYRTSGWVTVPFPAGPVRLRVLCGEDDDLYIPFRDTTCGPSSYVGGRYVTVEKRGDRYEVDFNKAINPYCAYDPDFSCPLPPPENRLNFPITAGELDFS